MLDQRNVHRSIYPYGAMNGDVYSSRIDTNFPLAQRSSVAPNFILSLFAYKRQIACKSPQPSKKTSQINPFPMYFSSTACLCQPLAATLPPMKPMDAVVSESSITSP